MNRRKPHVTEYRQRLQARLERALEDADYAALRDRAGRPYDHSPTILAAYAAELARGQWPSNEGHSVRVPPLRVVGP